MIAFSNLSIFTSFYIYIINWCVCLLDNEKACSSSGLNAAYPYDCTQYYDCEENNLNPPLKACGEGFVFSPISGECQRPYLVPCAGIEPSGK